MNVSAASACFSPVRGFHLSYLLLNSYYALQTALSFDSRNEIHRFSSYVRALRLLLRLLRAIDFKPPGRVPLASRLGVDCEILARGLERDAGVSERLSFTADEVKDGR